MAPSYWYHIRPESNRHSTQPTLYYPLLSSLIVTTIILFCWYYIQPKFGRNIPLNQLSLSTPSLPRHHCHTISNQPANMPYHNRPTTMILIGHSTLPGSSVSTSQHHTTTISSNHRGRFQPWRRLHVKSRQWLIYFRTILWPPTVTSANQLTAHS